MQMKWLFGKTMLSALIGAVLNITSHGLNIETITGSIALVLGAAGVRHALEKNNPNTL